MKQKSYKVEFLYTDDRYKFEDDELKRRNRRDLTCIIVSVFKVESQWCY